MINNFTLGNLIPSNNDQNNEQKIELSNFLSDICEFMGQIVKSDRKTFFKGKNWLLKS